MQRKSAFSRRLPDLVTEELVSVLSKKGASFEFKQLFDVVHERLKKRNAASGGEEMLRLRAYEKLQHLVSRNMVKKNGKKLTKSDIHRHNLAILGYCHDDATRKGILSASGLADDGSTLPGAVDLNNLDDWFEFHAAVLK